MFAREITGLTLTNEVASSLFSNISGDYFRDDESFIATLRALLYSRVPEEESIRLRYRSSSYNASQLNGAQPKDCVRAFLRDTPITYGDVGILYIHSFDGNDDTNTACLNMIDSGLNAVVGGYEPLADVSKWIETNGKFRTKIYINREQKNVLIFVKKLTMKRWHLLEALIPRYFPWYVDDNPFNDEEVALLKTLTKRYAPDYESQINNFAKKFDFRSQIIRSKLTGFETKFDRRKLGDVRDQISSVDNSISRLEQQFASLYQQLNNLRTTELGLMKKINMGGGEESSELLDYFLQNKSLNLMSVLNGRIEFIVTTTLANFDPDAFESIIRNRDSYFYRNYDTGREYDNDEMTDDRIERLMREIFEKESMKVRICAAYMLDFDSGSYAGLQGYRIPREILLEYTPNQHIHRFHCLGGNEVYIRDAMRKRDYVGAIEACVASAKSMNVVEGITCGYFMEAILSSSVGKVIELPDGSLKTPVEAVKWLEEQDVKAQTEEE